MSDWSTIRGSNRIATSGVTVATSLPVLVASGGGSKGSWVELIASTAFPSTEIRIVAGCNGNTNRRLLVDIGVGSAGNEVVIIPNLYLTNAREGTEQFYFPISIPAETRISARSQADNSTPNISVQVQLNSNPFVASSPLGQVTAYGANTGTTRGVTMDPGAIGNTKGAWVEIVASTSKLLNYMSLNFGHSAGTTYADNNHLVDIAVGAGGSEVIVIGDIYLRGTGLADAITPNAAIYKVAIPAGTRIAARSQSSDTSSGSRVTDLIIHGVE